MGICKFATHFVMPRFIRGIQTSNSRLSGVWHGSSPDEPEDDGGRGSLIPPLSKRVAPRQRGRVGIVQDSARS